MDLQPRQRTVALACLLAGALVPAPGALAASSREASALPGGFGVRPVIPKGRDMPPSYFVLNAKPGQVLERSVIIVNGTKATKHLIVDGVDGITGQTTGVVYANRDERHREASRWVRPRKHKLHVAPGTTKRMRFIVKVPKTARPGDHLAGLAFEDARSTTTKSRFAVKQVVRVVVGVQIQIQGGLAPQATAKVTGLQAQPGTSVATAIVRLGNEGDRLCKPTLKMTLQPQDGEPRVVERRLDTVLPHDRIDYPLPIPGKVAGGTYGASAKVTGCGQERIVAANVLLAKTLDGSSPQAQRPAAKAAGGLPTWLPIAALVLLGAGAGMGGVLMLQRLQRRRLDGEPA